MTGRTSITPTPTDAETAAIAAAIEVLWTRPTVVLHEAPQRVTTWKFSGRWWAKPVPSRRNRPFV